MSFDLSFFACAPGIMRFGLGIMWLWCVFVRLADKMRY